MQTQKKLFLSGGIIVMLKNIMEKVKSFTKLKNIEALILVLIILSYFLAACGHIEDTNGDSYELVTITLEQLAGTSISNTSSGVSISSIRRNKTILTQYEDIDLDSIVLMGGKTSGISNIMATFLNKGTTLEINSFTKVDSGNVAMVLISPDNEILHNFAIGEEDFCQIKAQESGIYKVRMGAESFSGEINVVRSIN